LSGYSKAKATKTRKTTSSTEWTCWPRTVTERIAEGKAEEKAEEKAETVKKSNKAGLTVELIADITGLTIEEINAILNGKAE
jgi:predicted transposase YdaD